MNDWYGLLSANGEAAKIFLDGSEDFDGLDRAGRARFHTLLVNILIPCEMMFRMGSDRLLPGASLEAVDRFIADLFRHPGVVEWWRDRGCAAVATDWGDYVERLGGAPRPLGGGEYEMNWEAMGAAGEVLGAIAVVATVFYLAVQTRRATQANLAAVFQNHFHAANQQLNEMWSAENAELMIKGLQSFSTLSPSEKGRFDAYATNVFNLFETAMVHVNQRLLGPETLENWQWYMSNHLLHYPGVQEWWDLKKPLYPLAVREWIDAEIAAAGADGDFYGILEKG